MVSEKDMAEDPRFNFPRSIINKRREKGKPTHAEVSRIENAKPQTAYVVQHFNCISERSATQIVT